MAVPSRERGPSEHPNLRLLKAATGLSVADWIRDQAERLTQSVRVPPVDPVELGRTLGAEVRYDQEIGAAALLVSDDRGRPQIVVGRAPKQRIRWDIAHELVHLLLLRSFARLGDSPARAGPAAVQEIERVCNFGASEILIPRHLYAQPQEVEQLTLPLARSLAKTFRVTETIAFHRVVQDMPYVHLLMFERGDDGCFRVVDTFPKPPIFWPPRVWVGISARGSRLRPDLVTSLDGAEGEVQAEVEFLDFGDLTGRYSCAAISLLNASNPTQADAFLPRRVLPRPQRVALLVDLRAAGTHRKRGPEELQLSLELDSSGDV